MKIIVTAMREFALSRSRLGLIRLLKQKGWDVVAVCQAEVGISELRSIGVRVENIDFFSNASNPHGSISLCRKLREIVGDENADLMHVFNAMPIILSGMSLWGVAPPVSLNTVTGLGRGYGAGGVSGFTALCGYGVGLSRASYNVCQNTEDRRILINRFPWLDNKTGLIVGSGVDTSVFQPNWKRRQNSAPVVMMISRLMWSKGVADFVELAAAVKAVLPNVRFQLGGELMDGDPDGVPEAWITKQVDRGVVEYIGYVDELECLLPNVDVVVHPTSYREGVPRIVLEAGSCGIPVVTTFGPGNDDVVISGQSGVLYRAGETESLYSAVYSLLADPEKCKRMGEFARNHVETNFNLESVNQRYMVLYENLLASATETGAVP